MPIACELCGHVPTDPVQHAKLHDAEIFGWLADDSGSEFMPRGARMYYAFKRQQNRDYPGLRQDVRWMMYHSAHLW